MEIQGLGNNWGFGEVLQLLTGKKGEHFRKSLTAFYFYIIWDFLMSKQPECVTIGQMEKNFSFFFP